MIGTDSTPFVFVSHLQSADVHTEVVHKSYVGRPDGSCTVCGLCFSKRNAVVGFTLPQHTHTHTHNAVMNYLQAQLTFSSQHASEPATLKAAGYDLCYRLLWCGIVEFNVPLDTFYGSYDTTNSVTALKDNGQVNQVKGQSYQARLTER